MPKIEYFFDFENVNFNINMPFVMVYFWPIPISSEAKIRQTTKFRLTYVIFKVIDPLLFQKENNFKFQTGFGNLLHLF